jgi:hypothetical protein
VAAVAWNLCSLAQLARRADARLPLAETDGMTPAERIQAGDAEGLYDAIVEAAGELDGLRDSLGLLLAETPDVLRRLSALRAQRELVGETVRNLATGCKEVAGGRRPRGR